jgi:hypothetical protein
VRIANISNPKRRKMSKNAIKAKCAVCGALAVAYFPVWDIDQEVPPKPYCRKCLDKAKYEFYVKLLIGK